MSMRLCCCGKRIPWNRSACCDCIKEYGGQQWFVEWTRSMQREINAERRHNDLEYIEEEDCPDDTEIEFEEFIWVNQ